MRVLLTSWAWPSHYYPMVPLGWALQAAGHDVLVASQPALAGTIAASGLPGISIGSDVDLSPHMERFFERSRNRRAQGKKPDERRDLKGKGPIALKMFIDLAEAMVVGLLDLTSNYKPDLIVYDPTTYAAPIAAATHNIPSARQLWGVDYIYHLHPYETEAFIPLYHHHNLHPENINTLGTITLDPCPTQAQITATYPRHLTQYIPYNGPSTLPPWLLTPPSTHRICLTWGTSSTTLGRRLAFAGNLIDMLGSIAEDLNIEVVAALSEIDNSLLSGEPSPRVRVVERLALHLLLPTCDAIIHQGGMGTTMTAITTHTPQLIIPQLPDQIFNAQQFTGTGAALHLSRDTTNPTTLRHAVHQLLTDPTYRHHTTTLHRELDSRPPLTHTIRILTQLTT
jgi:UDP:flavonoid glycosyltransferase YjiC (YdhE family)